MSGLLERLSKLSPAERAAVWARVNALLPVFRGALKKSAEWRLRWGAAQRSFPNQKP